MNVLIVNTSEKTGGAAIAANRLMEALIGNGVKAKMLVRDAQTDNFKVISLSNKIANKWKFVWDRGLTWMYNHFHMDNLWDIDIAAAGTDITKLPEFQWANVIHLHWVNQGFLSMNDIRKIVESGKRVVWTLHDQWPYTGICHYAGDCTSFQDHCDRCPMLSGSTDKDISYRIFKKKLSLYQEINRVRFVGCSQWITDEAKKSALFRGHVTDAVNGTITPIRVTHIPNTINQTIFKPGDKAEARKQFGLPADKKLLLFSSLKVTDERKGIKYLIEACQRMHREQPQIGQEIGIVVVGKRSAEMESVFPFQFYPIPYITEEKQMAQLYTAVDAFVTPSLQDNLPNTIVEAMSVGTPCVGFNVGGIPEMIHHKEDGYVAKARDAKDLAEGILYVLDPATHQRLSEAAALYALHTYNPSHIVRQYLEVYRS